MGVETDIGVTFTRWGDMDDISRQAWFDYIRKEWVESGNLMKGYATLHYATRKGE